MRSSGKDNDFPFDEPDPHLTRSPLLEQFEAARSRGSRVVLSGDGDKVFGLFIPNDPSTLRLFDASTIKHAFNERRLHGRGSTGCILTAALGPCIPYELKRLRQQRRLLNGRYNDWLKTPAAIDMGFVGRYRHLYRGERERRGPWSSRRVLLKLLRDGNDVARYSFIDRCAAYAEVEKRWPLLDRRVVDLLLNAPNHLRFRRSNGRVYPKHLLRKAVENKVPKRITKQSGGGNLTGLVDRGLRNEGRKIDGLLHDMLLCDLGFLDESNHRTSFRGKLRHNMHYGLSLFQPILIESWLRENISTFEMTR